ncbi:Ribosomal export complex protein Arx15 / FY16936)) [Taphrina deformans PYCC 5710]|uniref:Probable metalloprotease ARX1 n=1 Tax=Taphrina deformans (strain PYCC 5710 / ATCC 11124 / CBS 356.35 / IMI 108563 / JCM 9778 / NBRC 8474) TaxID=1097556 RepID=R4XH47_TAPDE|nr:Ribosomal export complex protein Arx15 / FY16936)) [Taphrina deformans PYCC 5710]|eukprot:CCG82706.1 Ribosomal export complex protein Arx15 / FY16936)) [Taphrina deformans PYCC 5710]
MAAPMQIVGLATPDDLTQSVLIKYNTAARFANQALAAVLSKCQAGANTQELCTLGDQILTESTQAVYKTGVERGIAEPTTVNVNNALSSYSPMDSPYILQIGDVVKVSLGAHIDGYTAKGCHTTVIAPINAEGPLIAKPANAIIAAYYASEAVIKMLSAANDSSIVTARKIRELVEEAARTFHVTVVEGSKVRRIKRYLVGQARVEEDALGADQPKQVEWHREVPGQPAFEDDEFVVEQGEAWLIDIAMSTGSGKVREHLTLRPTIYVRDATVTYNLKLRAAQSTLREIQSTKSVFPFCLRSLSDQRTARMGISECKTKGVVSEYPVLLEHPKETIARQASTLLLSKSGNSEAIRLTGGSAFALPWVKSEYEIETGSALDQYAQLASATRVKEVGIPAIGSSMEL